MSSWRTGSRELVSRLNQFVATHPVDVALVTRRRSDYAAAQWAREPREAEKVEFWPVLSHDLVKLADELGEKAARGDLSLFVGAGASTPLGFPSWKTLLAEPRGSPKTNSPRT